MAWRIDKSVVRGELDNRVQGKVTGKIWFLDQTEPVTIDLKGNPWRDLAGCQLTFTNPKPISENLDDFDRHQSGSVGDMTASRKVKVPNHPIEKIIDKKAPMEFHWSNCLYLEWHSQSNGRVVIETVDFEYQISLPSWTMSQEAEAEQQAQNDTKMVDFIEQICEIVEDNQDENKTKDEPDAALDEASDPQKTGNEPPIDESAIDQILRINDLKYEAESLSGNQWLQTDSDSPLPLDIEEAFWQQVVDFEKAPTTTRRELIKSLGISVQPPEEIDDITLTSLLWDVINGLATSNHFIEYTNHLSDRELYELLYKHVLEEETTVFPENSAWRCHINMSEYGTSDGLSPEEVYLSYYADDIEREQWEDDFPDQGVPEKRKLVYNRDHLLPAALDELQNQSDEEKDEGENDTPSPF